MSKVGRFLKFKLSRPCCHKFAYMCVFMCAFALFNVSRQGRKLLVALLDMISEDFQLWSLISHRRQPVGKLLTGKFKR